MSKVYPSFYQVVNEAIADILLHGFDSAERIQLWMDKIGMIAKATLTPEDVLQRKLQGILAQTFNRTIREQPLLQTHKGIPRFTLASIQPRLRGVLDRHILASADLIRLNKKASVEKTLQRFSGWATSIPAGGSKSPVAREEAKRVRTGLARLPFEERRVIIDQGHKLVASVNAIIAMDGGAIAACWHHVREAGSGYQPRPEHEARDDLIYVVRGSWALEAGLMKLAGRAYTDAITQPAQEPYCRCWWEFFYNLRDLPEDMLTVRGKSELLRVRGEMTRWTRHASHV